MLVHMHLSHEKTLLILVNIAHVIPWKIAATGICKSNNVLTLDILMWD